jgi:PIN domain nuclease of toxin-antitoxin system
LYERGRLQLREDRSLSHYLKQLLAALRLEVLPITAEIALLSRSRFF